VVARLENRDDLLVLEPIQDVSQPGCDQPAGCAIHAEEHEDAVARGAVLRPDGSCRLGKRPAGELTQADRNRPIVEIELSADLRELSNHLEEHEPLGPIPPLDASLPPARIAALPSAFKYRYPPDVC